MKRRAGKRPPPRGDDGQCSVPPRKARVRPDPVLLIVLALGLLFCLHGIRWGWVEDWNPDQMAFKELFREGLWPLNPGWFQKPPFATYFNYFFSIAPWTFLGDVLGISGDVIRPAILIWSRLLTAFLFLGSIVILFVIAEKSCGTFAARCVSALYATSAGLISFSHFLTADLPVLFWMLFAFLYCRRIFDHGDLRDYILAGFLTGIATATKYNGLGVGTAIVAAHLLSPGRLPIGKSLIDRRLWIGLAAIPLGFISGCPYSILDFKAFYADFAYNNAVTPVFSGRTTGHGYSLFLEGLGEILGLPGLVLISMGVLLSVATQFRGERDPSERRFVAVLLIVFAVYFLTIGSFPRLPTRFVLPVVPYFVLLSAPFWKEVRRVRWGASLLAGIVVSVAAYNGICSSYVGHRFNSDPRSYAQRWVRDNVPGGSTFESSHYSPRWDLVPGVRVKDVRMPNITGRRKLFEDLFLNNPTVLSHLPRAEKGDSDDWYGMDRFQKRGPDYVALNSLFFAGIIRGKYESFYPSRNAYFNALLSGEGRYRIVFDRSSEPAPWWVYPRRIDFLDNRMMILRKVSASQ
jgi:hypothetical protein